MTRKIKIIIACLTGVVVVGVIGGVLGVVLSSSSDDTSTSKTPEPGGGGSSGGGSGPGGTSYFLDNDYMIPGSFQKVAQTDVNSDGSYSLDGKSYMITKENDGYYLNVNQLEVDFDNPIVELPLMYDEEPVNKIEGSKWFPPFDNGYYNIDFMNIGYVKFNDGNIWGGFVKDGENFVVDQKIRIDHQNGYLLGSLDDNGDGGINMLKLQKLKVLLDEDDATTEDNVATTTSFGFFINKATIISPQQIKLPMNKTALEPKDIGIVPNPPADADATYDKDNIQDNWWFDTRLTQTKLKSLHSSKDFHYYLGGFTDMNGNDYKLTLPKDEPANWQTSVDLDELYYPISYQIQPKANKIFGDLYFNFKNKLKLPEWVTGGVEGLAVTYGGSKFSSLLSGLKVKLERWEGSIRDKLASAKETFCNETVVKYYQNSLQLGKFRFAVPALTTLYTTLSNFRSSNQNYKSLTLTDAMDIYKKFKSLEGSTEKTEEELKAICNSINFN